MRQLLLGDELAQHVDIAIGHLVGGEDVVVGDDDDLVTVPDPGVLAEVLLEDADGPGPADVMRHEHVDVDPDIIARLNVIAAGVASKNLFGQGHRRHERLAPTFENRCAKCYYSGWAGARSAVSMRRSAGFFDWRAVMVRIGALAVVLLFALQPGPRAGEPARLDRQGDP